MNILGLINQLIGIKTLRLTIWTLLLNFSSNINLLNPKNKFLTKGPKINQIELQIMNHESVILVINYHTIKLTFPWRSNHWVLHIMSPLAQGNLPQYDSPTFLNLVTTAASHGTTKLSSAYEPSRGVQLILCCNFICGFQVSRLSFTGRFHGGFGFRH